MQPKQNPAKFQTTVASRNHSAIAFRNSFAMALCESRLDRDLPSFWPPLSSLFIIYGIRADRKLSEGVACCPKGRPIF